LRLQQCQASLVQGNVFVSSAHTAVLLDGGGKAQILRNYITSAYVAGVRAMSDAAAWTDTLRIEHNSILNANAAKAGAGGGIVLNLAQAARVVHIRFNKVNNSFNGFVVGAATS